MEDSLELLEERFRRVEEASERRAFNEPELSRMALVDPLAEPRKHHKKPSVSISQFGKQEELGDDALRSLVPSPLSVAASKSTFYHTLANPTSIESLASENPEEIHDTDEQHELLVERITGRQTLPQAVGALLPRRLSRVQSQIDYISVNKGMVVDVLVETITEPSHRPLNAQKSTVHATGASRPRAATVGVLTALTSHVSLVERAKDFARKLRRRSRAELP